MSNSYLKRTILITGIPIVIFAAFLSWAVGDQQHTSANPVEAIWFVSAISFSLSVLVVISAKQFMGKFDENKRFWLNALAGLLAFISLGIIIAGYDLSQWT